DERAESTPRARQVPGRHRQMRQGLLRRSRWGGLREWRVLRSAALPLAGAAFESRTTDSGWTEHALGLWARRNHGGKGKGHEAEAGVRNAADHDPGDDGRLRWGERPRRS